MMNIEVISRETLKPYPPTPFAQRYLPFSLIDHANIPVLMPLIFFYSPSKNMITTYDNNVVDRLKRSFPHTLSVFYPLAGRVKDVNHIVCNDEGVPYVEAKVVDKRLDEVVHKAELHELDQLVTAHGQEGYTKLLLAIQVTSFACGGLAIGVKMSHGVSDAFSFFMFVKTWAAITKGKHNMALVPRPFFEIWKIFPPFQPQLPDTMDALGEPNTDLIEDRPTTKRFVFRESKLSVLRSKLHHSNNQCNASLPSLAMVLSAFIWSRVKVACYNDHTNSHLPYEVFHAINIRPKLKNPLNSYYFGNMVVNAIAKPCTTNKRENLCNVFLERMQESISKIVKEDKFVDDMKEGKEDLGFVMDHFERASRKEIISLGFSTLRSLPVYESNFGWGQPMWVTSATLLFKDLVILMPSSSLSRDIDAYINLGDEDMEKLLTDKEFMSFVSYNVLPCATSLM